VGKGARSVVASPPAQLVASVPIHHKNIQKLFASWINEDKKTGNIITEFCISNSLRQYVPFL
jgi:hypothetical protein